MDEDSEFQSMEHLGETLQELIERLDGKVEGEEPCPVCFGTGTELITNDAVTVARICRHIG